MSKKVIGYFLIFSVIIVVLIQEGYIDTTNYKDFELANSALSEEETIEYTGNGESFISGENGLNPGFYDVVSKGGSTENDEAAIFGITYLYEGDYLNSVYISDNESIVIDGTIVLTPSKPDKSPYTDNIMLSKTTELIVGENIEPGEYEVESDIPKNSTVFITSNNNNKIDGVNQFIDLSNNQGSDISDSQSTMFKAKKGDVLTVQLTEKKKGKSYYASFPVEISKVS